MSDDEQPGSQVRLIDEVFAPAMRMNALAAAAADGVLAPSSSGAIYRFAHAMSCECGPGESCPGCTAPTPPRSPTTPRRAAPRRPFGSPPAVVRRPRRRSTRVAARETRDMLDVIASLPPPPGLRRQAAVYFPMPRPIYFTASVEDITGGNAAPADPAGGAEAPAPSDASTQTE
jgi:hypothetical protein